MYVFNIMNKNFRNQKSFYIISFNPLQNIKFPSNFCLHSKNPFLSKMAASFIDHRE